MDPLDPRNLDSIKLAYVKGDWSIQRIADEHSVCATTVRNYARKDGWVREVGTKPRKRTRYRKDGKRSADLTPEQRRVERLLRRLYKVLEQKVKIMEQRLALQAAPDAPPQSAADAEREMRTMNALTRALAKLIELQERRREEEGSETQDVKSGVNENANELRRDLALRVGRLRRTGNAE